MQLLFIIALVFPLLLTGCLNFDAQPDPTRYYLLNSIDPSYSHKEFPIAYNLDIGVKSIKFPEHLDTPRMATLSAKNEITYSEFNRWATPLKVGSGKVLAKNLSILFESDTITSAPWSGCNKPEHLICLEIESFIVNSCECEVSLDAVWSFINKDYPDSNSGKRISIKRNYLGHPEDYRAITEAMSDALAELSYQIASDISNTTLGSYSKDLDDEELI